MPECKTKTSLPKMPYLKLKVFNCISKCVFSVSIESPPLVQNPLINKNTSSINYLHAEQTFSSGSQETLLILCAPKFHYCVKCSPYSQPKNPDNLPTHLRSISVLSSHLRLGLRSNLFPSCFITQLFIHSSPFHYVPHVSPITFSSIISLDF
jgi:hypothetical protein